MMDRRRDLNRYNVEGGRGGSPRDIVIGRLGSLGAMTPVNMRKLMPNNKLLTAPSMMAMIFNPSRSSCCVALNKFDKNPHKGIRAKDIQASRNDLRRTGSSIFVERKINTSR